MARDYYSILGINNKSSQQEIKDAYRREVKKCHPDATRTKDTEARFRDVREAYETLGNEGSRKKYDRETAGERDKLRKYNTEENTHQRQQFKNDIKSARDFSQSIFDTFFNDLFETDRSSRDEYELNITLSIDEAYHGGIFTIPIPVAANCPECGRSAFLSTFLCPLCRGRGKIKIEKDFSIKIPAGIKDGGKYRLLVEDLDIETFYLNINIRIG